MFKGQRYLSHKVITTAWGFTTMTENRPMLKFVTLVWYSTTNLYCRFKVKSSSVKVTKPHTAQAQNALQLVNEWSNYVHTDGKAYSRNATRVAHTVKGQKSKVKATRWIYTRQMN